MHFSIGDMILDCLQNSIEAEASEVFLDYQETETSLTVLIKDNGKGMTAKELERAKDPFYTDGIKHKKRRVGLGIPFLIQTVQMTGGEVDIRSEKGRGTEVLFSLDINHIDLPPLGDVALTFMSAMLFSGSHELVLKRSYADEAFSDAYELRRSELREILGGLETSGEISLLKQFLASQEAEITKERNHG